MAHAAGVAVVRELADGVWHSRGFPPNAINVYLVEDVLVDAGPRHAGRRIPRQLRGRDVTAHPCPSGSSGCVEQGVRDAVDSVLGSRARCSRRRGSAVARPDPTEPRHAAAIAEVLTWPGATRRPGTAGGRRGGGLHGSGRPRPLAGTRGLLAGIRPGSDRRRRTQQHERHDGHPGPPRAAWFFTTDPAENRRSARTLLPLDPRLVLFGHGGPLRDTRKFVEFIAALPG